MNITHTQTVAAPEYTLAHSHNTNLPIIRISSVIRKKLIKLAEQAHFYSNNLKCRHASCSVDNNSSLLLEIIEKLTLTRCAYELIHFGFVIKR